MARNHCDYLRSVWTFGSQENGQIGTGTDGSYNSASSKVQWHTYYILLNCKPMHWKHQYSKPQTFNRWRWGMLGWANPSSWPDVMRGTPKQRRQSPCRWLNTRQYNAIRNVVEGADWKFCRWWRSGTLQRGATMLPWWTSWAGSSRGEPAAMEGASCLIQLVLCLIRLWGRGWVCI